MAKERYEQHLAAFRHFNRFYTHKIGILDKEFLHSEFSLTEARVIFELFQRERPTAAELSRDLGLDPGYLSRLLRRLSTLGLLAKETSATDGRQQLMKLTRKGEAALARLNTSSNNEIGALLMPLPPPDQQRLLEAMHTIQRLLGGTSARKDEAPYTLRPHRPGDIGWVVHRHGALYAQEYGWDESFEALVADIASRFLRHYDPQRERCWIAEKDGQNVGSVFLVKESKTVAKLRMLIVEPAARGLGLGKRLVDECVRFAREAGYRKVRLWTDPQLHAARRLYEQAGFVLVKTEPHDAFGKGLIGQTWELTL
ncbi:helix-turn-helix domain-containing GNAT family N-acetyltransferase [Myxococcus sp. K15C18031901]|uniref:bifunctional helix-turn-helix transcriptional regulator/GNAT family N-acetyltransferase n=1 Tax=Myxococcus dinghuensis TaxID=2906761 RepID=UPI0020A74E1C|nr:helix-turn-helix domain-containing GNAT family N-acetyltransferase [Myxococcus dinghuensis]MCP3103923.1 helix-turn-helix domain-containing GNAT family N-acetyltransferase [Myxococcus dinghuensis]